MNDAFTDPDFPIHAGDTLNRLRGLFDHLVDLPAAERDAWLYANVSDSDERTALLRLLAADDGSGFLDTPAMEHAVRLSAEEVSPDGLIGREIGSFRILRALGQGGMAAVFLGERSGKDFTQVAAIKLLRRGLYSELEQRLFLRERQVLAALSHPNIARLIDGGVTEAGIPYLVMEYVDGLPITRYADAHRLGVRQRLSLFLTVCRAVEAAHRSLVVHRDIKPSNILVTETGETKLLDFGIAKLIEDDSDGAMHTATVGVYTPGYAAPEQVNGEAITTATDVYGLGVLLHELLIGMRPQGTPTRRPSSLLNTQRDTADGSTANPIATTTLRKLLRGDIDNILLKTLEVEPERRYVSAGALADDIARFLEHQPVAAHPPSRVYKTRKFIQRHRGGVAMTLLFVVAILAAFAVTMWQAKIARSEAQRANNVRDFLVQLFDAAKANLPRNQRPTPEFLVQEAAKRARNDTSVDAALRAELLRTLGTVSLSMGDYAQAESLLDDAIKRERDLGVPTTSPQWLDTLVQKGNLLQRTNRNTEADQLIAAILPELRAQDSNIALSGLMLYSETQLADGHADVALSVANELASKAARFLPPDSIDAVKAASYPGQISVVARHYKESVPLLEPVVVRWRALGVPLDDDFAQALNNLAVAKERSGDPLAAEALFREGIALRRRIYDGPHDELATALEKLAIFLIKQEKFDEAQSLLEEALAMNRKVLGPDSVEVASTLDTLGVLESTRREFPASEKHLREAVTLYVAHAVAAGKEQDMAIARNHLAQTLVETGKLDEAAGLNAAALAEIRILHGENNDLTAAALYVTGRIALARPDIKAAVDANDEALKILAALEVPNHRIELINHQLRAQLLEVMGRKDEALAEANIAIETLKAAYPDAHAKRAALLALRARLERALGKPDAATASITEALQLKVATSLLSAEDAATLDPRVH